MNKSVFALIIIVLFVSANVSALTIDDLQQTTTENTHVLEQKNAELMVKIISLEQKIQLLPTKEDILQSLEAHLNVTNQIMDNFRSNLIIYIIVINLCSLGVAFGFYFYYKGKGRI